MTLPVLRMMMTGMAWTSMVWTKTASSTALVGLGQPSAVQSIALIRNNCRLGPPRVHGCSCMLPRQRSKAAETIRRHGGKVAMTSAPAQTNKLESMIINANVRARQLSSLLQQRLAHMQTILIRSPQGKRLLIGCGNNITCTALWEHTFVLEGLGA